MRYDEMSEQKNSPPKAEGDAGAARKLLAFGGAGYGTRRRKSRLIKPKSLPFAAVLNRSFLGQTFVSGLVEHVGALVYFDKANRGAASAPAITELDSPCT
ncbi:hypothetical protein GCM10028822_27930 [Hymenobacter terrigena]